MSYQPQSPVIRGGRQVSPKGVEFDIVGITHPLVGDIIMGRGGGTNNHPGNLNYRRIIDSYKPSYSKSPKREKLRYSCRVVDQIRNQDPPGRFLKKDAATGLYYDIGDKLAREKTSQCLREGQPELRKALGLNKNKGANSAKRVRERERQQVVDRVRPEVRGHSNPTVPYSNDIPYQFYDANPPPPSRIKHSTSYGTRAMEAVVNGLPLPPPPDEVKHLANRAEELGLFKQPPKNEWINLPQTPMTQASVQKLEDDLAQGLTIGGPGGAFDLGLRGAFDDGYDATGGVGMSTLETQSSIVPSSADPSLLTAQSSIVPSSNGPVAPPTYKIANSLGAIPLDGDLEGFRPNPRMLLREGSVGAALFQHAMASKRNGPVMSASVGSVRPPIDENDDDDGDDDSIDDQDGISRENQIS